MFGFRRELKKLFGLDAAAPAAPVVANADGLTGGDAALLEMLDLALLRAEAKAADVAAGRVSAKDPAQLTLQAAVVWREAARRAGDAVALRKAAAQAEAAAKAFEAENRPRGVARARCEQAACALLAAELFGGDALEAAADGVLALVRDEAAAAPLGQVLIAAAAGRRALAHGTLQEGRAALAAFDAPLAAMQVASRRSPAARLALADQRLTLAELTAGLGARFGDAALLQQALHQLDLAAEPLDVAYEPVSVARIRMARGSTLGLLGRLTGDLTLLTQASDALILAASDLGPEQSPLDWARSQVLLGGVLQMLADATMADGLYEQAVTAFDRAMVLLRRNPVLPMLAHAANARVACLARCAEMTGDLAVLDVAEAALKIELSNGGAAKNPVGWAVAQTSLARLYEARIDITRRDDGRRHAARIALAAAVEVFDENHRQPLADLARQALDRLTPAPAAV